MLDLAQGVREQIIKETAPKVATKGSFTLRALRHATLWGAGAVTALMIALLSTRGEIGAQRLADVLRGGGAGATPVTARTVDTEAEIQRLTQAVRGLTIDGEDVKSRLAAVEHDMDDVTGSISKQIEAADAARRAADGPSVSAVASATVTAVPAVTPSSPGFAPLPIDPAASATPAPLAPLAAIQPAADSAVPVLPPTAYGVDIGSGLTMPALRARWAAIRSAHPQLFAGLEPIVSVKEVPRGNRVELRLVVGPFADAGTAAQLCTALAPFGLFCQPTMFDGQRLALR